MTRTAVLFPGQGAQHVGMGRDFVEKYPVARELFERANDVLSYDIASLCLEGPDDKLTLTRHCQPAIFLTSAAIVSVLEQEGSIEPSMTAGLSLGEYTALYYAGVFAFEDGLELVAARGDAMQRASDNPPSGMISLMGADIDAATEVAAEAAQGEVLSVANILSPGQIVLSGTKTAIARVPAIAKENGIRRAIELKVAGAFHSDLMAPAAKELAEKLADVEMREPRIPVVSNVTGAAVVDLAEIRRNLEAQVVKPVLWQKGIEFMIEDGIDLFVEPGPGRVLTGLLRKIDREKGSRNVDAIEEVEGF